MGERQNRRLINDEEQRIRLEIEVLIDNNAIVHNDPYLDNVEIADNQSDDDFDEGSEHDNSSIDLDSDIEQEDVQEDIEDNEFAPNEFTLKLAEWHIRSGTSGENMDALLLLLRNENIQLPKSTKTLLNTPTFKIIPRVVEQGEYFHYGIQTALLHYNDEFLQDLEEVVLDIGIDGIPLYKSSRTQLWPILGAFVNRPHVPPFLIGSYYGKTSPQNADIFLEEFLLEVDHLTQKC